MNEQQEILLEELRELNPEALLPDGFEDAFVGIAYRGYIALAAYDYEKCLEVLMRQDMDVGEADDYMQYNVLGAWLGESMPVFLELANDDPPKTKEEQWEVEEGSK